MIPLLLPGGVSDPSSSADWDYRSTMSGVVFAKTLTESDILMADSTGPDLNSYDSSLAYLGDYGAQTGTDYRPSVDSSVIVEGHGSLKFTIIPLVGGDPSGYFFSNFQKFGENEEFFFQVRVRWNEVMATTHFLDADDDDQAGIKFFDITCGDEVGGPAPDPYLGRTHIGSSHDSKMVIQTYYQERLPSGYGYDDPATLHTGNWYENVGGGEFALQNSRPSPYCRYPASYSGCWLMPADEWVTFLLHVKLGDYAEVAGEAPFNPATITARWADSRMRLYVANDGGRYQELIDWNNTKTDYYDPAISSDPDYYGFKLGKFNLFPFMTNKSFTQNHDTGYVWYAKPIVSTEWVPAPATAEPSWLNFRAVHEWIEITGTTHAGSDAAPGQDPGNEFVGSNSRLAFSNFAVFDSFITLLAAGGHGDYSGNECTGIELARDTPEWELLKAATSSISTDTDTNSSDDTPTSRHLYNSVHYSTTYSRFILHATQGWYSNGSSSGKSFGFNPYTGQWDASTTWGTSNKSAACRDSRDNCWSIDNTSGHKLYKWTADTAAWTLTLTAGSGPGSEMAHNSVEDYLLAMTCGNGVTGSGMNAAKYTSDGTGKTDLTLTGSGLAQMEADLPFQNSLQYDRFNNRFLHWNGTTSHLYSITISGSTATVTLVSTTGTPPPTRVAAHGRMQIIDRLATAIFMPSGTKNLYAMRLE